jgi:hypothetical protein
VIRLFFHGFPVPEPTLRDAIDWLIHTIERRARRLHDRGDATVDRAVKNEKSRTTLETTLLSIGARGQPRSSRSERAKRRKALQEAVGIVVQSGLEDQPLTAYETVEWLRLIGLKETADAVETEFIRENSPGNIYSEGPFELLRQHARAVPFERLRSARAVIVMWDIAYFHLAMAVLLDNQRARATLTRLQEREVWRYMEHVVALPLGSPQTGLALTALATSHGFLEACWELAKEVVPIGSRAAAEAFRALAENADPSDYGDDLPDFDVLISMPQTLGEVDFGDLPLPEEFVSLEQMATMALNRLNSKIGANTTTRALSSSGSSGN